jgi:hypothetical protein
MAMTRKRQSLTDVIEEAVDKGATTVEQIHKSIADLPLKLLEESERLGKPAKEVRRLQDRAIGALYDLVRDINRRVARLLSDLLRGPTKRSAHAAEHVR